MLSQLPNAPRQLLPEQQDRGQPQSREFDLFSRISQRLLEQLKKGHLCPEGQQPSLPMMWPHSSPLRTPTHVSVLPRVRNGFRYLETLQDFSPKSFLEHVSAFLHSQYPTGGSFVEGRIATCRPISYFCFAASPGTFLGVPRVTV